MRKTTMHHDVIEIIKHGVDAMSVGSFILVIGDILTPLVLVLTVIWTIIRINTSLLDNKLKRKELKKDETKASKIRD